MSILTANSTNATGQTPPPTPSPLRKGRGAFGGNWGLGSHPQPRWELLAAIVFKNVGCMIKIGAGCGPSWPTCRHRPSPLCPLVAGRCRRVLSGLQIKRRCKVTAFGATICGLFWFISGMSQTCLGENNEGSVVTSSRSWC